MATAEKAAAELGGMSGKAVKAIMTNKNRTKSRLDSIMSGIDSRREAQSTDSNNRK